MIEAQTNQFWKTSLAWKRVSGFVEGKSTGDLLDALCDTSFATNTLKQQAEDLKHLIVMGKMRRPSGKRKHNVIHLKPRVNIETQNIGLAVNS